MSFSFYSPHVLERTADRGIDNVSVDDDGIVWAAGMYHDVSFDLNHLTNYLLGCPYFHIYSGLPDALTLVNKHFSDPSIFAPSSALRISINTGPAAFYGEKFKVEKVRAISAVVC